MPPVTLLRRVYYDRCKMRVIKDFFLVVLSPSTFPLNSHSHFRCPQTLSSFSAMVICKGDYVMPKAFNLRQSFHTQQSKKQDGLPSTKFLRVRSNTMTTCNHLEPKQAHMQIKTRKSH